MNMRISWRKAWRVLAPVALLLGPAAVRLEGG